jgi:pimeloyl-ACP methyl ester carboxylesterase/class 3 adenylate cyclase
MTEWEMPETQYAQSGDLSIAYQVLGGGDFDVVFVSGFVSHLELAWEVGGSLQAIRRLANCSRLITFDKRGTGLSERTLGFGSAEERMDDIRAVMNAVGSERAALVGLSEGGPLAILFAATYPERVSALVLWDTYARGLEAPDYPIGLEPTATAEFISALGEAWGTGYALGPFLGAPIDDEDQRRRLARFERNAATPKMATEILTRNVEIDVRTALSAISAPTLVLHRTGDPVLPLPLGKYVADHIRDANFVEMPGEFHVSPDPGGDDDAIDLIEEFLTGSPAQHPVDVDRVLATVLFTDIVSSTERAAELGDRQWRTVLDDFRVCVRRELDRHRGHEVNTRGDDFLATFDGPGRAVRCAQAIATSARPLGLEVRSGLHTGEVELQGDDVAGLAVHIGARVAALAGAGEVLATSTVRDLVVGSGINFDDRGRQELKGVPGEWTILAVA